MFLFLIFFPVCFFLEKKITNQTKNLGFDNFVDAFVRL